MASSDRLRLLRSARNYHLCGRVARNPPLVNVVVLFIEIAGLARVAMQYGLHFSSKPILTMMITNSLLNGAADTIAQTVTSIRAKNRKPRDFGKKESISIEIHELNEKGPLPTHRGELLASASPTFDFERLVRYMAWGITVPALWRVAFDQLIFSPISLAIFFIYMTLAEGGGKKAVIRKFDMVYISALKSNYILWPAVQILNFRIVPLSFQLPFASTVGIAWTVYLSLTNDAAD
ncbi:hypothetical protein L873DRAFT_1698445 [Choiromyces venosus 120613-1]|uniref:Integral membrane protein, Mpv17/PMP22 family n=1 Tax=Choiromyces venosus 120613-1 TaxID=1336337 RepID=A0A3N4JN43_9PEZI|nr:hypothetical protein L873DRAFT_1698445 [Choiromyces venosus 120613-1]